MFSLKEIDKIIAEIDEAWTSEIEVEKRLSEKADEFNSKRARENYRQEQARPRKLSSRASAPESASLIEKVNEILELQPNEAEIYKKRAAAARIINPCFTAGGTYSCQTTARSKRELLRGYNNFTSSCNVTLGQGVNDIDVLLEAKGTPGLSRAQAWASLYFAFPPYRDNAKILVDTCIQFEGVVHQDPNASVSLWFITRGLQDDEYYVSQTHTANLLVNTPGQSDTRGYHKQQRISFIMDVYPRQFVVQVWMAFDAKATGKGSHALIDFSTGANRISILWVNTQPLRMNTTPLRT